MTVALYPGSFDPIHLGHVALIEIAARAFDRVFVAVTGNPSKQGGLFTIDERVDLAARSTVHLPNVTAVSCGALVAPFARRLGVDLLIRGIGKEQQLEFEMATANWELAGVRTVFLPPTAATFRIASREIREELDAHGVGAVAASVPPVVAAALAKRRTVMASPSRAVEARGT